ncbi:MAG: hypothetical protein O7D95_06480 [Betaproteobacteria bacterium]|nr:hypothetical protein [Betaproteobacteria bacterium]
MATSVISSKNPAILSGSSQTLTKSGSDNIALFVGHGKLTSDPASLDTFTHNNAIAIFADQPDTAVSTLWVAPAVGHQLDGDITETAQTLVANWDVAGVDFFGTIVILDGVDQTTPLSGFSLEGFGSSPTARSYTGVEGDTIVYSYVDTNSVNIDVPTGFTALVTPPNTGTSQLDEGVYAFKTLGSDETSTVIAGGTLNPTSVGGHHYVFVVKAAAGGAESITADSGSYSISGTTTPIKADFNTISGIGSYSITGTTTPLKASLNIISESGSYTTSGTNVDLRFGSMITADAGSYIQTGTLVNLNFIGNMTVDAGSYIITGTNVGLLNGGNIWTDLSIIAATWIDGVEQSTTWTDESLTTTTWTDL